MAARQNCVAGLPQMAQPLPAAYTVMLLSLCPDWKLLTVYYITWEIRRVLNSSKPWLFAALHGKALLCPGAPSSHWNSCGKECDMRQCRANADGGLVRV